MLTHTTKFPSFSWLNIILCTCTTPSLSIHPFRDKLRLLSHLGYWKSCCNEHGGADNSLISCFHFLWIYTQMWDCWIIIVVLFLIFWANSILFSIVTASVYIPTSSTQGFFSLFINTFHLLSFSSPPNIQGGFAFFFFPTLSVVVV